MSDIICTNCRGQSTSGCWLCNPSMHQGQPIDPITNRIRELEAKVARVKAVGGWLDEYSRDELHIQAREVMHKINAALSDKEPEQ